jgi:Gram-negative bacterial TonB protein C-terminal
MNKSNALGSLAVHASIVALVLLCGSAIHPMVESQRYHETLVLPIELPVPVVLPSIVRPSAPAAVPAQPTVARMVIAPARANAAAPEAAPQPVKLDTSSSPELPQVVQRTITVAPQIAVGGFASAGSASGHSRGGTVGPAGFGTVSQGTGSNASVKRAGFEMTQSAPVRPATTTTPADEPPVILNIPHAKHVEGGLSGRVLVRVILCSDKTLKVLGISEGLSPEQDAEALRIAGLVTFTPAMRQGQPVDHTATLVVEFLYSR